MVTEPCEGPLYKQDSRKSKLLRSLGVLDERKIENVKQTKKGSDSQITPNSWSLRKVAEIFKVSKSTIQKVRHLKVEKGIFEMPESIRGRSLQQNTVDSVIAF